MAFRILYNAASDLSTATITSDSQAGDNVDDNIANNRIGKKWRTSSDTTEWIKWDMGSSTPVDVVGVFATNLQAASAGASITFEGNATDSWGSPSIDESITIPTNADGAVLPRMVKFLSPQANVRYYRITVDDPSNPATYIEIGRAMFGAYYETTRDISDGWRVEVLDPSTGDEKPGQVPVRTQKNRFRRISCSFEIVGQTEADKWHAIFDHIGNSRPALISWNPAGRASEDSAYVYLKTPLDLVHQFIEQSTLQRLVWEEKTR